MPSDSTRQHRHEADDMPPVRVAVLTVSDTRTPDTDTSGALIVELLERDGHTIVARDILPDEPARISHHLVDLGRRGDVDAVLTNGGTGITPRDGTFEAVTSVLDRPLPGFGELFRMLSWDQIGAASMLSRAVAGLHGRMLVFAMPGSRNAVGLAMERLILPELRHLVYEMKGVRESK